EQNIREEVSHALRVSIDRNTGLNRFMANFADVVKLPMPQFQAIDMSVVIGKMIDLFQTELIAHQIKVESELSICNIKADPIQMEQVLVNIIKNSIEAIGTNGVIGFRIQTKPHLSVFITDTGKGFSEETNEKLFSPFFSTKKTGQGIGLTLVREILLNHNFQFSLRRTPDHITAFMIQFE
ncbi:MAG: ATP-binding protein, partial [Bacteroidales bacterium]|nr:ATP-binding protein [Bacteroidales bacterium]